MKEFCCPKDCPERKLKCHSFCERHQKYQQKKDEMKEAKRKEDLKHVPIEKPYLTKANIKKKER